MIRRYLYILCVALLVLVTVRGRENRVNALLDYASRHDGIDGYTSERQTRAQTAKKMAMLVMAIFIGAYVLSREFV